MAVQLSDYFLNTIILNKIRADYTNAVLLNNSSEVVSNVVDLSGLNMTIASNKVTNVDPIVFECAQGAIVYNLKLYNTTYPTTMYLTIPIDGSGADAFTFGKAGTFTFRAFDLEIDVSILTGVNTNISAGTGVDDSILSWLGTYLDSAVILNSSYTPISDVQSLAGKVSVQSSTLTNTLNIVFNCSDGSTVSYLKLYDNGYESTRYITVILEEQSGSPTFIGDGTFTIPAYSLSIDI